MSVNFTHLHVHSRYTLLGATPTPEELAARAAAAGFTHLALTDTNALYGAVAFDRACRAVGVQPILGMTVTVAWPVDWPAPLGQLQLLATGPVGYRSLCRLSSLLQGHPDRVARLARGLALDDVIAQREGLLCLSGGRRGWLERCLRAGDVAAAQRFAEALAHGFGDAAYLSLEIHEPDDVALAQALVDLGASLDLRPVAVQPVYCLEAQDAAKLHLLAAIDRNCALDAVPPEALPDGGDGLLDVHWLSKEEMSRRFAAFPEALARVGEVAGRCAPALPTGTLHWPQLALPAGQTADGALTSLAEAGLRERFGVTPAPEVHARLLKELAAIARFGYAPLFIIVANVVRHARANDIPVSTRGSVANSLVAYCCSITTVDPIEHDLLFERFLSPARADAPDIDLDFCSRRRDDVLEYVRRTYGAERVALVATLSTLQPRSALRETAKAYGVDSARIKLLLKGLPHGWRPAGVRERQTLAERLAGVNDAQLCTVLSAAYGIEGHPHHLSVHPGGVVIAPRALTDFVPVQWAPKGFLITQFDHRDVAAVGLPKLDLLGIRALTVLADAAALVRRDRAPDFRLTDIPLDDARTAALLAEGDTVGVFQCDSEGARRTLRQLRARTLRDLAVANAFFKPGPASGGLAATFVRRYRGEEAVTYLHPSLEPILAATQGVPLYQEQILRLATEIAGLSWEQAGHLRRGMSKMDAAGMASMRTAFVAGCQGHSGFTPGQAAKLWEQVAAFAGYGFNQGHATAYADVSYRSAYLKAHWPAAFFCARLRDWGGYHHPSVYMAEALRLGIEVRLPHVNASARHVTLAWEEEQPVLWLGLNLVRDLRRKTVAALVAAREQRPFADVRDLAQRVRLQGPELAHLIQGGALDGLGSSRAAQLSEAVAVQRSGDARQMSFGFAEPEVTPEDVRQRWAWEKEVLGYPLQALRAWLPQLAEQVGAIALRDVPRAGRRVITACGVRLPGWGRGSFALWDGATWALAKLPRGQSAPAVWVPQRLAGRWLADAGAGWLQVLEVSALV